jgi:phosphoserine aminotransferase
MAQLMTRPWNFGAGPATLPEPVLERVRDQIWEISGKGVSPLEIGHRSSWFEEVIREAESNIRSLLGITDSHAVIFCQGGASMQFAMAPMNLITDTNRRSAYLITGSWSERAVEEARKLSDVAVAWSGRDDGYRRVPDRAELQLPEGVAYTHMTSNETIQGVQWAEGGEPAAGSLVCDGSSDFLSRPVDIDRYGILYAGAQKNAGPAGVTIVIVRRDILERAPEGLPSMLDYRTYVRTGSLHNTPPVLAIWVLLLVTRWLRDEAGGLERQDRTNRAKAALLYDRIDSSSGFYAGHAMPGSRSLMNVTFRLPSDELERAFLEEAEASGMIELRGHRSVGGIRASIYNAMPLEGVEALAQLMADFAGRNG